MDTKKWISLALCFFFCTSAAFAQNCAQPTNAGFESDLAGWSASGTVAVVSDAHSGSKAARIGTAQGGVNRSSSFPVVAGQPITLDRKSVV